MRTISTATGTPNGNLVVSQIIAKDDAQLLVQALEQLKRSLGRKYDKSQDQSFALQYNLVEELLIMYTSTGDVNRIKSKGHQLEVE